MKVSLQLFLECLAHIEARGEQRVGQYLMNTLVPSEINPTIFYEIDSGKALGTFFNTYVEVD